MKSYSRLLAAGIVLLAHLSFGQNSVITTTTAALPGGGTGSDNVVVGPDNTYASANNALRNVFVGKQAGLNITTGVYNSFIGHTAGYSDTRGSNNAFIGSGAGYSNTIGSYNSFIGYLAGQDNFTGIYNSFTGSFAGLSNTTGNFNSFTGSYAGYRNTTGYGNLFAGYQAGFGNTAGFENLFEGYQSGYANTTGNFNTFMGSHAGFSNTTGGGNVFSGHSAGSSNTIGGGNSFMGYAAGYSNTIGGGNSFIGYFAGQSNTVGENNVFTGREAGYNNSTGSFNTFIGNYTDGIGKKKEDLHRASAFGYRALVAVDDGLVLGDTTNAKVGIGTAYPNQRLTIRGNMNFVAYDNSLRLKNRPFLHFNEYESLALGLGAEIAPGAESTLVLGSSETEVLLPGVATNYLAKSAQVLTVDERGKVILTQPRIQVPSTSDWADKVFEKNYPLRTLSEVEDFVKKHKHLPGIPSAETMVTEGMESAAFNAKLLEKIEELTLYVVALEKRLKELEK